MHLTLIEVTSHLSLIEHIVFLECHVKIRNVKIRFIDNISSEFSFFLINNDNNIFLQSALSTIHNRLKNLSKRDYLPNGCGLFVGQNIKDNDG